MDNFDFALNLTELEDVLIKGGFEPLPAGEYTVECVECIGKTTKAGDGFMWATTFVLVDSDKWSGRKVWHYFNVKNKSEKAQNIARAEVKRLLTKKGVLDLAKAEPTDMVGVKVVAKIGIKDDPQYGAKNVIQGFVTEEVQASEAFPF